MKPGIVTIIIVPKNAPKIENKSLAFGYRKAIIVEENVKKKVKRKLFFLLYSISK